MADNLFGLYDPTATIPETTRGFTPISKMPGAQSFITGQKIGGGIKGLVEGQQANLGIPYTIGSTLFGFSQGGQNAMSNLLGYQKTQQDIQKTGLEIEEKEIDVAKKTLQTGKLFQLIQSLPEKWQILAANSPEKFVELYAKSDPQLTAYDPEDVILMKALNITDSRNLTANDANVINSAKQYMPQGEADKVNAEERAKANADPLYKPQFVTGQLDYINSLKSGQGIPQNKVTGPTQRQIQNQASGISSNRILPNGNIIGLDGKTYTQEQFNNLPYMDQVLNDPYMPRQEAIKERQVLLKQMRDDKNGIQYQVDVQRGTMEKIEKILNDPSKFKKAFGTDGKLISSLPLVESDAKDVWALLRTLQSREFTRNIQGMRNANPTGGAVGNVSNMEGVRFEEFAANISKANTADQMWEQLKGLYDEMNGYEDRLLKDYYDYYGDKNAQKLNFRPIQYRTFANTPDEAITSQLNQRRIEKQQQIQNRGQNDLAIGSVVDGYQYMGGDKGNPNSWRKL